LTASGKALHFKGFLDLQCRRINDAGSLAKVNPGFRFAFRTTSVVRSQPRCVHAPKEWHMLVLSRKKDESIVINNDITIVVVEIRGDKVRLGVEAPKEVPVHRREVYEAIARGEPVDDAAGDPPASLTSASLPGEGAAATSTGTGGDDRPPAG